MSKVKRILSVIMAMVMVLAMSVPTFAAGTPKATDKLNAGVKNVEAGASVTAYQIVKADYNTKGFIGYVKANDDLKIANVKAPTSEEVTKIAADLGTNNALGLATHTLSATAEEPTTYKADLEAGFWIVLVRGTTKVYNPMLVGVYYSTSGSDNSMAVEEIVDATTDWDLVTNGAYAKSTDITIEKSAVDSADIGDEVEFTVKSVVPDYSAEYTQDVKYEIKDTLTNLKFADSLTVNVSVDQGTITTNDYKVTRVSDTEMKVAFNSTWVKANGKAKVTLVYKATMTGNAVNNVAHSNKAELNYTNNPGVDNGHTEDIEKVYTFDVDGDVTANILKKVQVENGENVALPDAEFTLYTDEKCETRYSNTAHPVKNTTYTVKSDNNGKLHITGLDQGTYYLKETKAPRGFTLNNTVYKIEITATIETEELKDWNVKITPLDGTNKTVDNKFTVSQGTVTASEDNELTEIMNTNISTLPSTGGIGTTIFTIGGCAIMIVAAGLFFATRRKTQK